MTHMNLFPLRSFLVAQTAEAKPLCRLWLNMHIKKLRILINVHLCSIWLLLAVSEEHVFIIFCACPQKTKLMNCSKAFIFIFKIYILIFKELKQSSLIMWDFFLLGEMFWMTLWRCTTSETNSCQMHWESSSDTFMLPRSVGSTLRLS